MRSEIGANKNAKIQKIRLYTRRLLSKTEREIESKKSKRLKIDGSLDIHTTTPTPG
jgi:hypothetical protein